MLHEGALSSRWGLQRAGDRRLALIIFVVAVILRCAVTTLYVAAFDEPEAVRHGHHSRPGEHAMVKGDALNDYL